MGLTLTEKTLKSHLMDGEFVKGNEIGIRIDQTLTQDATGINAGILPLTFANESDYDKIAQGNEIALENVRADIEADKMELTLINRTTGENIPVLCELTGRTKDIILAGGLLDFTRESLKSTNGG